MFLKLGIVGRALGLQGSFYISGRDEPIPKSIKNFKIGKTIEGARDGKILSAGWQQQRPFIKCDLASDRTSAELLIGLTIWIEAQHIQVDDDKEFLLSDLKGRAVYDSENVRLGTIEDVVVMPASINIVVVSLDQSADVDIPMISTYVDMGFKRGGTELRLLVPKDTFEEVWNTRVKK